MSTVRRDFVTILLNRLVVSPAQVAEARRFQLETGDHLEDAFIRLGYATAEQVMVACAESLDVAFLDLEKVLVPLDVIELVPESVARENCILPVARVGGVLTVACADPADHDTLQKLEFILNKAIRPVLARREQLVEAINFYYGQAETESVDSMLAEFTDTAIDFTDGDDSDFELSEAGVPAAAEEEPVAVRRRTARRVGRHATVRYYHRMNPQRMFPLLVVLSERAVREVARRGVAQARSGRFEVAEESLVEVEPVLPGCHCYPPREQVRVGRGEVTATFWVVPHVLGRLMQARVVVRQDGATLAEVPLEARVVRQSATVAVGALSMVLPFVLLLLKHFRLDFESQLADGFGLYARLANWALNALTPELLTGLLLAATLALYLWLRPRRRDVFWDVATADPPAPEDCASKTAAPEDLPGSRAALLRWADGHYQRQEYDAALPLYERALELEAGGAAHYFRASVAAFKCGDVARALAILRRAEAVLPASEMRGAMWYNMACCVTRLGRFPEALRYLNRAVDAGYSDAEKFRGDPDLEPLRWHAGFKRLLLEIGA